MLRIKNYQHRNNAFTLVELAIVLVIVGLLVGGVIAGQELIKQFEYKRQISDVEELHRGLATFKMKYGRLPGDLPRAKSFFSDLSAVMPGGATGIGDGNGEVTGYCCQGCTTGCNEVSINHGWPFNGWTEWNFAITELILSKIYVIPTEIIQYQYSWQIGDFPRLRIKSESRNTGGCPNGFTKGIMAFGYMPSSGHIKADNKINLGYAYTSAGVCSGLNSHEAEFLDSKMDDGKPYTGKMYAIGAAYSFRIPANGYNIGYCANTQATNTYLSENNNRLCEIVIDTGL